MRSTALFAAAVIFGMFAGPLSARAAALGAALVQAGSPHNVVQIDSRCGLSWHWVPEGRGKDGVWRFGHCVPDWLPDAQ